MLQLITAPTEEPITLAEAKLHLRVDTDADDALITAFITAARQWAEEYTWRAFVTQTWDYALDAWPHNGQIYMPRPTLQSVTTVTYTDENGSAAVMSDADYFVDVIKKPGRIVLNSNSTWPSVTLRRSSGIVIRFVAGYGAASAVPEQVKAAIKLIVGDLYENRESTIVAQGVSVVDAPFGAKALLNPLRMRGGY